MQKLTFEQAEMVSGGDAAATREPYTNSWGEWTGASWKWYFRELQYPVQAK